MKLLLSGVIALVAACRYAEGGEGIALASADPLHALIRLLCDFGGLGAVFIYFVWRETKDRAQKADENKRWTAIDERLFTLVEKCTQTISECTTVLAELSREIRDLRKDVWRLMRKKGRADRSDTDVLSKDSDRL